MTGNGERECASCGLVSSTDNETCPYCGYEFPELKRSVRWVAWLMAALLAWPLFKLLERLF